MSASKGTDFLIKDDQDLKVNIVPKPLAPKREERVSWMKKPELLKTVPRSVVDYETINGGTFFYDQIKNTDDMKEYVSKKVPSQLLFPGMLDLIAESEMKKKIINDLAKLKR